MGILDQAIGPKEQHPEEFDNYFQCFGQGPQICEEGVSDDNFYQCLEQWSETCARVHLKNE